MLSINNVTKKYGSFTALKEINLELENGVYGLLAPNGAGKTTLLNMIATLSFPTHGEITWDGIDIVALDEKYRDILGFLPQQFGYYKNYTPKQFLKYMATLKGIEKNKINSLIDDLLEKVSLSDVRDKKIKKLYSISVIMEMVLHQREFSVLVRKITSGSMVQVLAAHVLRSTTTEAKSTAAASQDVP